MALESDRQNANFLMAVAMFLGCKFLAVFFGYNYEDFYQVKAIAYRLVYDAEQKEFYQEMAS